MEGRDKNMAGDELDINEIVKDDKSFKVWVVMRLREGTESMSASSTQLNALHARLGNIEKSGLPQCEIMNTRVSALEHNNRLASAAIAAVSAGLAIISPKAGAWIGRMWGS